MIDEVPMQTSTLAKRQEFFLASLFVPYAALHARQPSLEMSCTSLALLRKLGAHWTILGR